VLLLHGQPGGARDWAQVVGRLRGRAEPIAIDRPGWDGRTPAQDFAGNARASLAALDARGIDRATIVGHSYGAAIAAWIAAHHPERVTSLVLAAPAANLAALEPVDRWLAMRIGGYLASSASLTGLGLALAAGPVRRWIIGDSELGEGYLKAAGRALLTPWARRAFATEQRALIADLPALDRRLGRIVAPTSILTGGEDRVVPAAAPRELAAQIPGARLTVLGRAGHLLPQLHSGQVADAIELSLGKGSTV